MNKCTEKGTTVTLVAPPKLLLRAGVSKGRALLHKTKRNKTKSPILIISRPVPCINKIEIANRCRCNKCDYVMPRLRLCKKASSSKPI